MKILPIGKGLAALGLGTWKAAPGEVQQAIEQAIRLGYRHIDCAAIYGNEAEIGAALKTCTEAGLVTRDELWITSKLWNDAHRPDDVQPALERTLRHLELDYLDLYLIHWPVSLRAGASLPLTPADFISLQELPLATTWQALEKTVDAGLARHIGVSNFNIAKLSALLDEARIKPAVNQIEMHPYLQQPEMLDFCARNGVILTAYSPLGSIDRPVAMKGKDEPVLLEDPVIKEIAGSIGATPAQVLLAWALNRGTSTIPKSTNPGRLAENLAAAELDLGPEAMSKIDGLDRNRRYIDGSFWAPPGSPYSVEDLWDS